MDFRDTRIDLVLDLMKGEGTKGVIVEVTTRGRVKMKTQWIEWTTRAVSDPFKGRWVKVRGWMLLGSEHLGEAENTAPGRARNWSANGGKQVLLPKLPERS